MDILINWTPGLTLAVLEKQAILAAFRFYRGNKTQASQSLGISVRTLDNKLDEYKVNFDDEKERQANERADRNEFLERCRGKNTPNYISTGAAIAAQDAERARHLNGAAAGVRVEPLAQSAPQQPVSVPERQKVQSVLPAQPAVGSAQKRR